MTRLVAWAKRYAKHIDLCAARRYPFNASRCDCGLAAALREAL